MSQSINDNSQTWRLSAKGIENLRKLMIPYKNDAILLDHKHDSTEKMQYAGINFELHIDMVARHKILLVERGVWLSQRILDKSDYKTALSSFKKQIEESILFDILMRHPILIDLIEPAPFQAKIRMILKEKYKFE